jgi:hypothetical protein
MPLTKKQLEEIGADMAAEQAYYKRLYTVIEAAKHSGRPIPQVRPFPGRGAGDPLAFEPTPATVLPARELTASAGTAPRRGWARTCLGSIRHGFGRLLHPARQGGPVL